MILKSETVTYFKCAQKFSFRQWKWNKTKVAEEYCWAITQTVGRSSCCRSGPGVLEFEFQLDSLVCICVCMCLCLCVYIYIYIYITRGRNFRHVTVLWGGKCLYSLIAHVLLWIEQAASITSACGLYSGGVRFEAGFCRRLFSPRLSVAFLSSSR
jgi:hypothetical protein